MVYFQENLKITNGIAAVPHSWPAHVKILFNYYVANYSIIHPNSSDDMVFINKTYSGLCAGTLIDRWTVMTASHCIVRSFQAEVENDTIDVLVEPNEFYPTYESMFTIFLGAHTLRIDYPVQKRAIKKIIKVSLIALK